MIFGNERTTTSEGRNGAYKCTGVGVFINDWNPDKKTVILTGITSKGQDARGCIELPFEDLDELIDELNKYRFNG